MKQGMQKETREIKEAQSKSSERTRGRRGTARSRAAEARAAAEAGKAMKQWRWRTITMKKSDAETRLRALAKINTVYQMIRDRGLGSDYCEKAIVRNEIRSCLEGTMVNAEQALIASWLKTNERTLALHADGKISRAQADFAWERAKRGALKSMVHLVHTKTGCGAKHAEEEIVRARLNRIDRGDPKMAEVSKPGIARAALLVELKELEEEFRSGNMGDVCAMKRGMCFTAPYTCMLLWSSTKRKAEQLNGPRPDGTQSC